MCGQVQRSATLRPHPKAATRRHGSKWLSYDSSRIAVLVTVVAVGNMAGRLATAIPFAGPLALGVIILTGLGWIVNELIELGKETRR
jgi:hypothetical protein